MTKSKPDLNFFAAGADVSGFVISSPGLVFRDTGMVDMSKCAPGCLVLSPILRFAVHASCLPQDA